jgi:hypothetical protein
MDCKATIHEGTRKGSTCQFPAKENGYCGRHERYKLYDDGVDAGKKWCRFFFRGCNNEVAEGRLSCLDCKAPVDPCGHEGCNFKKKKNEKYCGKHHRDVYRDEEKLKGITYCDIDRGCFNVCNPGYKTCEPCLGRQTEKDNERYAEKKKLHLQIREAGDKQQENQLCVKCSKDFPSFFTHANRISQLCKYCNDKQRDQDDARFHRIRYYKAERVFNIDSYIKEYHDNAIKRGIEYLLTADEFATIVKKPCHYCAHYKDDEVIGIDRVDNKKGYISENVVPCCELCNNMKYTFPVDLFLKICSCIATNTVFTQEDSDKWPSTYNRGTARYSHYMGGAFKRLLVFALSREQFTEIIKRPCYLCGYNGTVGIDRKNNKIGYTIQNAFPCCQICNYMKGDLEYESFIEHVKKIYTTSKGDVIELIPLEEIPPKAAKIFKEISPIVLPMVPSTVSLPTPGITAIVPEIESIKIKPPPKMWKANALYTAILEKTEGPYLSLNSAVVTEAEFTQFKKTLTDLTREAAIELIQKFMGKLNKRRKRL